MSTPTSRQAGPLPLVTLFESYGAGGEYVAQRVADRLGLPFHPQAFSSEELEAAAERRENEGLISRVFSALGHSSFGGLDVGDVASGQRDRYEVVMENTRIVQQHAEEGGVIMGRNGALILRDRPATLHVRLDAPVAQRVARAARDSGIDADRAAKRQKREDEVRREMSQELYGWDPQGLDHYDLVINTGSMDLDSAVDVIVAAVQAKARGAVSDRPAL